MNQALFEQVKTQNLNLIKKQKRTTFAKVFLTHFIAGVATLSICPQFGIDPFNVGEELVHYFMSIGHWACGLFCGSVFFGAGSLLSILTLSKRDLLYYSRHQLSKSLAVVSLFYLVLMTIGRIKDVDFIHYGLEFSVFWILGALLMQGLANLFAKPRLILN